MTRDTALQELLLAWRNLTPSERFQVGCAAPDLVRSLERMDRTEADLAFRQERVLRAQAMRLKVAALTERGAHVPAWMRNEAELFR